MVKAHAVAFTNTQQLSQELKQLNQMQDIEMAVLANFNAITETGSQVDGSCFIEMKNGGFDITEVLGCEALDLNLANLKFDLMSHEVLIA